MNYRGSSKGTFHVPERGAECPLSLSFSIPTNSRRLSEADQSSPEPSGLADSFLTGRCGFIALPPSQRGRNGHFARL
jgi:hypothetical protein